ncbi:MAG TPA: helix-turn-helix transcriptional regulator [Stellaceae bacterium]|nr:helix-turn-helix transcriptional regulator [Stellaceae bacterium]
METADNRPRSRRRARKRRRGAQDIYAGERLRVARQLAGVSQTELGDALGVSFQAVQKYESGENRLSAGRMVVAAAFLGVDLAFFAKERTPLPDQDDPSTGFTNEEIDVIRSWRALRSEELRGEVKRLLRTMAAAMAEGGSGTR